MPDTTTPQGVTRWRPKLTVEAVRLIDDFDAERAGEPL